jgi:mevalonate kinase
MNNNINLKVKGKLMILGEHAVVYGFPCIVSAVNKYLIVEAKINSLGKDEIISPSVKNTAFVQSAIELFRKKFRKEEKVKISTRSFLGNFGLGSSAAVTVGVMKALSELFEIRLKDKELFDLCFQVILQVQKQGSGADLASCIYGNTIFYKGKSKQAKIISKKILPVVVGFSGGKASTVDLMKQVFEGNRKNPEKINNIFFEIERIVKSGEEAIIDNNWEKLGSLMNKNHHLLRNLGVSIGKLDKMVEAACKAGSYGAKLSGAGGGDCMIACVSREKRKQVEKAIISVGGEVLDIIVG